METTNKNLNEYYPWINRALSALFLIACFYVGIDAYRLYRKWESIRFVEGHSEVRMLSNRVLLHANVPNDMVVIYAGLILLLAMAFLFLSLNYLSDDIDFVVNGLKQKLIPQRFHKPKTLKSSMANIPTVENTVLQEEDVELELTTRFTLNLPGIESHNKMEVKQGVLERPQVFVEEENIKESDNP